MSPASHPFLARILPPFHHRRQPDNHPNTSLHPQQQAADSYVPTWQRERASAEGERATGRRKPSTSTGSLASEEEDERRRRRQRAVSEPGGGMLYFGEGGGQQQSNNNNNNNTHLCPPEAWHPRSSGGVGSSSSSSSRPRAKTGAAVSGIGPAFASGRDASGNLRTGVNSTSIMTGTYASLTYGGSVRL